MKITAIRHSPPYHYRMARRIGDANGPVGNDHRGGTLLYVDTDEGVTGISPTGGGPAVRQFEPLLLGQDPRGVVGLWKRMCDHAFKGGVEGQAKAAIGALDVALWDLKARLNEEPLWRTLGASSPRVKAYACGIDLCLSDEEFGELYGAWPPGWGSTPASSRWGWTWRAICAGCRSSRTALATASPRPSLMVD